MQHLRQNSLVIGLSLLYVALSCYLIWIDQAYLTLAPVGLLGVLFAIYYTEYAFLALAFLTPLSINIEEYTDSFGLFIPTEPLALWVDGASDISNGSKINCTKIHLEQPHYLGGSFLLGLDIHYIHHKFSSNYFF